MKVLFLSALESEAREFKKHYLFQVIDRQKRLALYSFQFRKGKTPDDFFWGITGVGPKSCRRFIRFISQKNPEFDLVILTGFCGALKTDSPVGRVLISRKLHLWEEARAVTLTPPKGLEAEAVESCTLKILADALLKQKILEAYPDSGFVDMESFYLVEFFLQRTSRLWLARAVTDGPGFCFPDFAFIQDSWASLIKKGLLPRLLCRPSQWGPSLALLRNVKKAGKGLFRFFGPLIQSRFQGYL